MRPNGIAAIHIEAAVMPGKHVFNKFSHAWAKVSCINDCGRFYESMPGYFCIDINSWDQSYCLHGYAGKGAWLSVMDPYGQWPRVYREGLFSWAQNRGIQLSYSRPGKPTDNAYIESFNGKFRDDCLNQHWFSNLKEARQIIENWRREYNEIRPHSTLGYFTPNEFARKHQDMVNNNSLALNLA